MPPTELFHQSGRKMCSALNTLLSPEVPCALVCHAGRRRTTRSFSTLSAHFTNSPHSITSEWTRDNRPPPLSRRWTTHPTTQLDKTILDWIVKIQLGHHRPKSRKYPAEDKVSSRSDSSRYMERDCLGRKCPNWSWYRKSVNSLPPDAMENVPAEDGMSSRSDS